MKFTSVLMHASILTLSFLAAPAQSKAQNVGETFSYVIEIARQGDIDTGQGVVFETRNIDVKFMGEARGWGNKKVTFVFFDHATPQQQFKVEFPGNEWANAKGLWTYATAHPAQCLQLGGAFVQAGSRLPNEPLDLCSFRDSFESVATTYSVISLFTPLQYQLEERGHLNDAKPNVLAPVKYLPADMVNYLKIVTNPQGRFWYRSTMVQHTGGNSRP